MIRRLLGLALAVACVTTPALARAQTTTGTISGRVVDAQGLALPGATVSASSPNLQGVRSTTTSDNGDYILTGLPAGPYTLSFELSGFQTIRKSATVAPTETIGVDAALGVGGVSETVTVVADAGVASQTAQVSSNFKQDLVSTLPTTRDINASLLLAPSVHPTGPSGAYSVAGSMSYETLFMVNGVNVSENLRGQAYDLYIEDAIQETHVATSGISAEYGRFGGGVVNVITKSGGNSFSGSFRDTLNNDAWRTLTPFEKTQIAADPAHTELRVGRIVPAYEYTAGGPIMKDHLWFFSAGRFQTQRSGRSLVVTNTPYTFIDETRRFEEKGTYSFSPNHTFQGSYTKIVDNQTNDTFNTSASMDLRSLDNRRLPQNLSTGSYNGVFGSRFTVEARVSSRHFSFIGSGAPTTDLIDGTLLLDSQRNNTRFWSPTFCGVCDPERRDNTDVFAKGTYFLSTRNGGSHNIVFGYDLFNDKRFANNHQSGSDYRIFATTSFVQGQDVVPQFLGDGTTVIQWNPIPEGSEGTNFRTHSAFVNDNWRVTPRLTANVGIRFDKNHGADSAGRLVASDSAFSPRAGVTWDPTGSQKWTVTASFAKYVAALSNSIADSSSAAGNPQTFRFTYLGPSINAAGPVTPTPDAIKAVFGWFNANGGAGLPLAGAPTIPGVTPQIQGSLKSPNNLEYAAGVSRQIGSRAAVRADYVFRDYRDFYVTVQDLSTGKVQDSLGKRYDLALIQNSSDLKRRYSGVTAQGTYRFGARTDVGGTYTLSRTWGNNDGENVGSGPIANAAFTYPEYRSEAWNYPTGDLSADQRHRARLWLNYGIPWVNGLTVSALQTLASGVPYGAVGPIATQPYVANPGYLTPPGNTGSTAILYYFTARDAFRTEAEKRTDIAVSYNFGGGALAKFHPFAQLQVLNVFNQFQLCGCGANVFANGGTVTQTRIDQSVLTNSTNASQFTRFDPFNSTPVEGTNWAYGPNFGKALNRFAYTTPREMRVTFGVRF